MGLSRFVMRWFVSSSACSMPLLLALSIGVLPLAGGSVRAQEAARPAAAAEPKKTQFNDALRLVEMWLEAQAKFDRVPAVSAGVVIGPDLVWKKGFGTIDARGQVAAGADTIYSICSISKLFTSVAVMQLWERGMFSLDDDIGKLVPAFAMQRSDADSGPITIRSLLTHSSGLPREGDFSYWNAPDFKFPTRAELLQSLGRQSTFMRVSDHYQYSNLAMALLGEVVASTSGTSYEEYVQRQILEPLKLADTRLFMPMNLYGKRLAQSYGAIKREGARDLLKPFDTRGMAAAAGFTSTVEDLARFASWQFRLRKAGGSELLRVATLRDMQRVQWTDDDGKTTRGLGFGVTRDGDNTVVGHTGVCPGYLSSIALALKDEVAVIAMANANDNASLSRYTRPMRQLMLKGLKLPVAPRTPEAADLESYAGRYASQPFGSESIIVPWGTELATLTLPTNDPAAEMEVLRSVGKDTFRAVRGDGTLGEAYTFQRDAAGQVTGVRVWSQLSAKLPR
jgi:CubicO group peptidase (beta-lactamase class C family)